MAVDLIEEKQMPDNYIVGVGMTPFGQHLDKSVKQLTSAAVGDALRDAGCERAWIEAAFFGNVAQGVMDEQASIRGQVALLPNGFEGIPIFNLENACSTASSAFHMADAYVRSGAVDVALAVGVDKIFSTDKAKMFRFFNVGWDTQTAEDNARRLVAVGKGVEPPEGTRSTSPYSIFMDIYAAFGRQLIRQYGITQRQMAAIAAKNHCHAVENERAQYRSAMTIDEVLAARPITYPLTLPMCAPISDGAAAAIVCSEAALDRLKFDRSKAVRIRASVVRSATARDADNFERHITALASRQAYEQAGIGPEDIDVAEVHDATAIGELIQIENLGFSGRGESGRTAELGDYSLGGRLPINPSGGLESKGHPVGATGLGQLFELVNQLRGQAGKRQVSGARLALQENGGGLWGIEEAVAHVGIFEAPSS